MSSRTMSKRLCTVIPRQSRGLSLYSLQHPIVDSLPLPAPHTRPTPACIPANSSSNSSHSHHPQNSSSTSSSPSTQVALSPFPRHSPASSSPQPSLFPPSSFPATLFPHLSPSASLPRPHKRSRFAYHLQSGAYGIPKRRAHTCATAPLGSELNLAVQVGEDAYFLRPDAMGVADGVGGWSKPQHAATAAANSALFSQSLMHFCSYELSLPGKEGRVEDVYPIEILQRSYERCLSKFRTEGLTGGSATALIAILREEELRIAHLGDCAVCVVRNGGIVYRSEEMQHAFNYPLQLGPSSPTLPVHARLISLPVQQNDIVILSSDGMTDNLWDEDVLDEVVKFTRVGRGGEWLPYMLSQALCSRAERRGTGNGEEEVPFARKAREEGIKFVGGKCDDISVLVAVIAPRVDVPS